MPPLAEETTLGPPYHILAQRLDAARRELAGITGEIAPEDVLERIFAKFRIGGSPNPCAGQSVPRRMAAPRVKWSDDVPWMFGRRKRSDVCDGFTA